MGLCEALVQCCKCVGTNEEPLSPLVKARLAYATKPENPAAKGAARGRSNSIMVISDVANKAFEAADTSQDGLLDVNEILQHQGIHGRAATRVRRSRYWAC